MYCTNCSNQIEASHKFCIKCGQATTHSTKPVGAIYSTPHDSKWWYRLARVMYYALHIPLPFVLYAVWDENTPSSYYSSYAREYVYSGSYEDAFLYTIMSLVIWLVVLRMLRFAFIYVTTGKRSWV